MQFPAGVGDESGDYQQNQIVAYGHKFLTWKMPDGSEQHDQRQPSGGKGRELWLDARKAGENQTERAKDLNDTDEEAHPGRKIIYPVEKIG